MTALSPKNHFLPKISRSPSPTYRKQNTTDQLYPTKSLMKKKSVIVHNKHNSQQKSLSHSLHNDYGNGRQKILMNFLYKYLERKDNLTNHEYKQDMSNAEICINQQLRIDPKFRRIHLKKVRQTKKQLDTRFLICTLDPQKQQKYV